MTLKVYSFDVFETCLVRGVENPKDLFFELARRISTYTQREILLELAQCRIEAEQRARVVSNKEDITIDDIYNHFPELKDWGISSDAMKSEEIQLEFESVHPILEIKNKIKALRAEGKRIIFISDMYLLTSHSSRMLKKYEIAQAEDHIYVSSELGICKGSGKLFTHVLEQEDILPHELLHHGDNYHSDMSAPALQNIHICPFRHIELNRYERATMYDTDAELGVRSKLSGISRAIRMRYTSSQDRKSPALEIAANIAAPFLTAYVAWVLTDARKQGIKHLFFLSRDGQIFYKIAQTLSQYLEAPKCHYIYGSRQAFYLPAIRSVDRQELDWLAYHGGGHSWAPKTILKRLHLTPHEVKHLKEFGFQDDQLEEELDEQGFARFWEMLVHPEVTKLILNRAKDTRKLVRDYFKQEGFLPGISALVDTGWSLRSQSAIKKIISDDTVDSKIWGYYLGIFRWRLKISQGGNYRAFFIETHDDDRKSDSTLKFLFPAYYPLVLEHVFTMCDHGTAMGYKRENGKIIPILAEETHDERMSSLIQQFQEVIVSYADEIGKSGIIEENVKVMKHSALANFARFMSNPTAKEAASIAWMQGVVDQVHDKKNYGLLARRIGIKEIFYIAAKQTNLRLPKDFLILGYAWEEGSLALSSIWVRVSYRIVKKILENLLEYRKKVKLQGIKLRIIYRQRMPFTMRFIISKTLHYLYTAVRWIYILITPHKIRGIIGRFRAKMR